ncbi:MAG TPA: hypothetical protein PK911_05095 [Candidatus Saccharibacteria bacterium]|nr:hypothetical protein [Candidatus Saccharibacteria bacterium]
MDAAITAFLVTLAIVGGILSPIIVIYILGLFGKSLSILGQAMINKAEEIKKAPPFDEVDVNVSPATRVMTVRFFKRGQLVWKGSGSQNANDEPLQFRTDED